MREKIKNVIPYVCYVFSLLFLVYTIYVFIHSSVELIDYYGMYDEKVPFFSLIAYALGEGVTPLLATIATFMFGYFASSNKVKKEPVMAETEKEPAVAEPEQAPKEQKEDAELNMDMTKAELIKIAKEKNIKVLSRDTKEDILRKLKR